MSSGGAGDSEYTVERFHVESLRYCSSQRFKPAQDDVYCSERKQVGTWREPMSDKTVSRGAGLRNVPPTEVSIADATRQHPRRWLLIGVTRRNEVHEPTHGHVLHFDRRESSVTTRLAVVARESHPEYSGLAILFANPRIPADVSDEV